MTTKVSHFSMLKQGRLIRFSLKDHVGPKNIHGRLSKVYGAHATKENSDVFLGRGASPGPERPQR
jgi:hypothetical protein